MKKTVLSTQRGIILSISLGSSPISNSMNLASAAEDRSIAIWRANFGGDMTDDHAVLSSYLGPWELVKRLNCGLDGIFCGRIWQVHVDKDIVVATGEDCHIALCYWQLQSKQADRWYTSEKHRGRNIWCLDVVSTGISSDKKLLVTGGNDGAICIQSLPPSVYGGQKSASFFLSLPTSNGFLDNAEPDASTTPTKMGPNEKTLFKIESDASQNCLKTKLVDFPRCVIFGPGGRLFVIADSGHISTCHPTEDLKLHVIRPCFHRSVVSRLSCSAVNRLSFRSTAPLVNIGQEEARDHCFIAPNQDIIRTFLTVFHGYLVVATSRDYSFAALGDIKGNVGLLQFVGGPPYMVLSDLLTVSHKIMKFIWVDNIHLVVCLQARHSLLVRISWPSEHQVAQFDRGHVVTIRLPNVSTSKTVQSNLTWLSAAAATPVGVSCPTTRTILVAGTRHGGLYTYTLPMCRVEHLNDATLRWSLPVCHGRGGCTSLTVLPPASVNDSSTATVISCGRTHGDIRRWSLSYSDGSLRLLATIKNAGNFTWVERLFMLPGRGDRIMALGFQSENFKAHPLCEPSTKSHCIYNEDCLSQSHGCFEVNCSGGNRCWDWYPGREILGESNEIGIPVLLPCDQSHHENQCDVRHFRLTNGKKLGSYLPEHHFSPALLASINKGGILVQGDSQTWQRGPIYLRPSLNGCDVNSCLAFAHSVDNGEGDCVRRELIVYCVAGGEDTSLSSWVLKVDLTSLSETGHTNSNTVCSLISPPVHHRGHLSNIRCMTVPLVICSPENCYFSPTYLLTGGGRGQISIWSLGDGTGAPWWLSAESSTIFHTPNWCPGWLGSIRLRTSSTVMAQTWKPAAEECDIRVMAMVSVQWCVNNGSFKDGCTEETNHPLLLVAACSDGSLRLLLVTPPNAGLRLDADFFPMNHLENSFTDHFDEDNPSELRKCADFSRLTSGCWLDIQVIGFDGDHITVAAVNTSGHLCGWQIRLQPPPTTTVFNSLEETEASPLSPESVVQLWRLVNQSGATNVHSSLCTLNTVNLVCTNKVVATVAVGSDDGSLLVANVLLKKSDYSTRASWTARSTHHVSAVLRVQTIGHLPINKAMCSSDVTHRLVTLSADQRVILWSLQHDIAKTGLTISSVDSVVVRLTPLNRMLLPGLGDPHDLAGVIPLNNIGLLSQEKSDREAIVNHVVEFALVTGTGSFLVRFPNE